MTLLVIKYCAVYHLRLITLWRKVKKTEKPGTRPDLKTMAPVRFNVTMVTQSRSHFVNTACRSTVDSREQFLEDSWRAVQVFTNHEKRVAQRLAYRYVEHFLPLYVERSEWTDRIVRLERPLFPGYVFTRFAPQDRLQLLSTPGVLHLLGKGPNDAIPNAEIERIRTALAEGHSLQPHPRIHVGTCVRIKSGIFANAQGIVTELRQNCKVVLELSGADQCFSLQTKLGDLEVINELQSLN